MKLVLLHGPARVASRKKLLDLKQKFDPNNVVVFEEGSTGKDISDNLMSNSLFTDERLVILENPPEDLIFDSFDFLDSLTLILWFDHEIKKIPQPAQVFFFSEGKEISVFPFLDKLAARDQTAFLEMDKLKKAGYDGQYLITMIFYLLRSLIATPKTAKPFIIQKLQRQRKNFTSGKITNLYKDILDLDFKIKSGLLEKKQAEFLLVNLFTH